MGWVVNMGLIWVPGGLYIITYLGPIWVLHGLDFEYGPHIGARWAVQFTISDILGLYGFEMGYIINI
jgi:hypothetical protein